jgi:hypothetical protein
VRPQQNRLTLSADTATGEYMTDRHLNLFFSYNHDTDLIENNLTRAWIVTMQLLSCELRERLLQMLLGEELRKRGAGLSRREPSFAATEFALQSHMDRRFSWCCSDKYIVAIASERKGNNDNPAESDPAERRNAPGVRGSGSIPDAWIFDRAASFCLLVEAKVSTNPLDDGQIAAHGANWFGLSKQELGAHLIPVSWDDLANVIDGILSDIAGAHLGALTPEKSMLTHLGEYLTFFDYRAFRGLPLNAMPDAPAFTLGGRGIHLPAFIRLGAPPGFRLQH